MQFDDLRLKRLYEKTALAYGRDLEHFKHPYTKKDQTRIDSAIRKCRMSIRYHDERLFFLSLIDDPYLTVFHSPDAMIEMIAEAAARIQTDMCYDTYNDRFYSIEAIYRDILVHHTHPNDDIENAVGFMHLHHFLRTVEFFEDTSNSQTRLLEIPPLNKDDLSNLYLARIYALLPPQPETATLLKNIDVDYNYDHLHMVTWFAAQTTRGSGHYSRSIPNMSARTTWNRLANDSSLLWIAGALGEKRETILKAHEDRMQKKAHASRCGAVRKLIPFDRILELTERLLTEE